MELGEGATQEFHFWYPCPFYASPELAPLFFWSFLGDPLFSTNQAKKIHFFLLGSSSSSQQKRRKVAEDHYWDFVFSRGLKRMEAEEKEGCLTCLGCRKLAFKATRQG